MSVPGVGGFWDVTERGLFPGLSSSIDSVLLVSFQLLAALAVPAMGVGWTVCRVCPLTGSLDCLVSAYDYFVLLGLFFGCLSYWLCSKADVG